MRKHEPLAAVATSLAFCAIAFLGLISHWKIFESDIFWQIRAGEEILRTGVVQTVDRWSSTELGHPWHNFQWLAAVLFDAIAGIGARYEFLPSLRALLVAAVMGLVALIAALPARQVRSRFLSVALLVPWVYLIIVGRLQLRPDIFGILIFAAMVFRAVRENASTRYGRDLWPDFALLVLWANFHGGTFPIGAAFFCLRMLGSPYGQCSPAKRTFLSALGGICWFLTPIGFHVMEPVIAIAFRYDWTIIGNPDHRPFTPELFDIGRFGPGFVLLAAWVLAAAAALAAGGAVFQERLPGAFAGRRFSGFLVFTLAFLTLGRVRSRPYLAIAALPVAAAMLAVALESVGQRGRRARLSALFGCALFWAVGIPFYIHSEHPLGFGISEGEFPVETARALEALKPAGKLANAYDFGGYLIDNARDYPVAQDGREYIFEDFFREKSAAEENPADFAAFLEKNGFNIALLPKPKDPSVLRDWYPPSDWEIAATDAASILLLRKKSRF